MTDPTHPAAAPTDASRPAWNPAAVLWDMDGTLVDTEPYWIAAEGELVAKFGGTWTEADAHSIVGFALLDSARELRDRGGVQMELVDIVEWLLDRVIERCQEELPWRPGARELLMECAELGLPCVLVTMSWARLADATVAAAPAGTFVATVPGDAVQQGKPHPEPYLTAAALLGLDPGDCLALEDSPTGVASAHAAGCATVAIPHVVAVEARAGVAMLESLADATVDSLRAAVLAAGHAPPAAT